MPEKTVTINGVSRLVWVESLDADNWRSTEHQYRREGVLMRRQYYAGEQYEAENLDLKQEAFANCSAAELLMKRLPEHQRKHAYSTQIKDGVEFIADQIANTMVLDAEDESFQTFVNDTFMLSGVTYRWQEVTQDMLIAGDVAARVIPRPGAIDGEPGARVQFWPAEDIEIDYDENDPDVMVAVRFERFVNEKNEVGENQEVRYVHQFRLQLIIVESAGPDAPVDFVQECVEEIFRDDDDEPEQVRRLGLPFIPWVHMSGEKQDLMSPWGKSIISHQVMENADRYNATCQLQYLVLRYNSFATLAVVGDAVHLANESGKNIRKDVADILTFPGGTGVTSVTLPTEVELFEVHKETLIDSMFDGMGLTRIDQKNLFGLGAPSGYALEILNRKSDGTFRRIIENMREGVKALIEMAADVDAYAKNSTVDEFGNRVFADVDPAEVWPNRAVRVNFGSTYVVDDLAVEREFGLSLISRREALRKKGYIEEQIDKVVAEIDDETDALEASIAARIVGA